jgi:Asp-tRNA(Asn)/Glu-tRNA(Gln) amidotransferase A subunit family amidase
VVRALKNRGASVLPVFLPNTSYALSAYYVIASAESSSNLARYDGVQYGLHVPLPPSPAARSPGEVFAHSRTAGLGAEVKRRILLGTYALTAEYASPVVFCSPRTPPRLIASYSQRVRQLLFASPALTPIYSRRLYARLPRAQPTRAVRVSER